MMTALFALLAWLAGQAPLATESLNRFMYVEAASEVLVTVRAACAGCAFTRSAAKLAA